MIEFNEEDVLTDLLQNINTEDRPTERAISEQLYSQMMGWA